MTAGIDELIYRKTVCLPPKIFFKNLFGLPKNRMGHYGNRDLRGMELIPFA